MMTMVVTEVKSIFDDRYWGERALEVIRTQQSLGATATTQWLSDLFDGEVKVECIRMEVSTASNESEV